MKSIQVFEWCLFAVALLRYTKGHDEHIERPTKCNSKVERFKHGREYTYRYVATASNEMPGITAATTDLRLSCRLVISVPRKCELIVQILDCKLHHRKPNHNFVVNENSHRLATELKKHPVYLQYNEGDVINHRTVIFDSEPQHIINIKNGIISILQLKVILHQKISDNQFSLHDVFGVCPTHMTTSPDSDQEVKTYRDLLTCNLSHVSKKQAGYLSFIKSFKGGHIFSPITELTYPFKLDVTCKHSVNPDLRIESAHCLQRQVYQPWISSPSIQGKPLTQISQEMQLESDTSMLPQKIDYSLTGRHWIDLAMEFSMKEISGSTSQDVMEELEQTVVDFLGQGNKDITSRGLPASSFGTLVDTMRGTTERELKLVKDAIYSCHNTACHKQIQDVDPKMLQSIEEKLFYNGLMSCGTDSCLSVFATLVRDDLIPNFEAKSVLYNMGLFYQPTTKVIHIILEHCKNTESQVCWLSLSAMIHRITKEAQNSAEMARDIFDTISHLHKIIGSKCESEKPYNMTLPEKTVALEKILIALKVISNIGETVEEFYNKKLHSRKSITLTLLHCIRNSHLNFIVARSATQALRSIGLQPSIISQLLIVAEDEKRSFVLRAAIVDILILQGDELILQSLLNKLTTTKLENMQTYIITRLSSLMESSQPEFQEQREKLGKILKDRVLPQLGGNSPFQSHYTQYSHRFTVPLISLHTGVCLTVNLIYTPSSNHFQSFTLETGYIVDNKTVHLFDITLDLEGIDAFQEILNKKSGAHQKSDEPIHILNILDMLQKYVQNASEAKVPIFAHYSNRVKLALQEIFRLAKFQKASFPYAHLSLKVFGYEMGSLSSDYLLMMVKQMQLKKDLMQEVITTLTEGIHTILLRAFMLTDFHKVIPTVSGFTMETIFDSSFVTKTLIDAKTSNTILTAQKKPILTDLVLKPSMSATFQANIKVSVGEFFSSGMTLKASGIGMGDWRGVIKYLPSKNYSIWEHDAHITWNLEQKIFQFLNIRSHMHLLLNDEEFEFSHTNLEKSFQKCLPDIYSQLFGHKICLSGASHSFTAARLDPTFLLMNPFRMEAIVTPADEDLNFFSLHLKYHKRTIHPQGYYIMAKFEGPGKELSRQVSLTVDSNHNGGALEVTVDIPDPDINYYLGHISFYKNKNNHSKYASVLSRHGKSLSSIIVEKKTSHVLKVPSTPNHKFMEYNGIKKSIHLNISFGVLSLDLTYRDHVPSPTNWITDVAVSYYCEPNLRLLYTIHPDPHLATIRGHTSKFSYHQETYDSKTSFSEIWKGDNKMLITLPGQSITIITDMVADLQGAHRVTDMYWKYGNTTDFYHMNSSVHNQSTTDLFNFDYFLHLSGKQKFDLDIEGHVRGPRSMPLAMLNISTDISFVAKQDAMDKRPQQLLSLILPQMNKEKVTSQDETSDNKNVEPFWEQQSWSVAVDTQISTVPHFITIPGGGRRRTGMEVKWLMNVSAPRGDDQVLLVSGKLFRGKTNWMWLCLEDKIHRLRFNWQAEQEHTPKIFYHHHNWTLEEADKHSFDRSFNLRINFEHYKLFEYDVILRSPWTNVTHHINYTKISPTDHTVDAFARAHSVRPAFDLLYFESSSISQGELNTNINLTSTYLDYEFELSKHSEFDGTTIEANLHLFGKLPFLRGEQTLSVSLFMPRRKPPTCEWTYHDGGETGTKVILSLLGPKKITVKVRAIFLNASHTNDLEDLLIWALELVESRYLQHTIDFSPETLNKIKNSAGTLHKLGPYIIRQFGYSTAQNILADPKDITVPLINKGLDEWLKSKLHTAMKGDPESKMVKLYKLALGGINDINFIWVHAPLVKFLKASHLDQAMAISIQTFSDLLYDWARQPPFLICQFGKIHIQPVLQQTIRSKTVTFSTPLLFVLPAFNKRPHLTVLERSVLGIIKHGMTGSVSVNKDIALIISGHTIKTFDGVVFDVAEPPRPSCTYLLGADFKYGQFGLTYTKEGVTAFSSRYGLTLAHDGSVFTVQDQPISHLPYTSPDNQLTLSLHGGELQLRFTRALLNVTFNPGSDVYVIEIDRKLKNISMGLLGTNNHESGDDFLLANGSVTLAAGDLQNSFELTNNKKCLVQELPPRTLCEKSDFPSCMSLSDKWQPVISCIQLLNPQPFILQCQRAECEGLSGCSAILTYLLACRHQGINIEMPSVCESRQKSGLDIVIVQTLHHSLVRNHGPLIACRNLVASLAHIDPTVGLVTYGGAGEWRKPKSHFLNGKLLERSRKAVKHMHVIVDEGEDETESDTAIIAAADYPFRPGATRVIFLVHQRKPLQENKSNAHLLKILNTRGITLVSASTYPELEDNESGGVLSTQDIFKPGGSKPPQDIYSDVVTSTSGMWLDLDLLNSQKTWKLKKVVEAIARIDSQAGQNQGT